MKKDTIYRKRLISICMVCVLAASTLVMPAYAAETETEQTAVLEGQLTLEDLSALNGGEEKVFIHNDRVTQVDGTCIDRKVESSADAAEVVESMMSLIGADTGTEFIPWREITDPQGNTYYIFQQMYKGTTVCGGAVKVITDADGNMIGLTSSVESRMPDVKSAGKTSAGEAEEIVVEHERAATGLDLRVLDQFTDKVILPSVIQFDIENEDASNRFAWVVYTDNPSGSVERGSDLPYLAHYVAMNGEYLYSIPAITPDDEAGRSGYDTSYIFEFMEPVDYTGYVDLSNGMEQEITVTVMRDKRTGMYYLGNIERRILIGQCYDFLYGGGQVVLESSQDNLEWDQIGLLSLYNYCRAYDYYKEIGWIGGDGEQTPILILNNFCDDHFNGVNNASYIGKINGMQCFAASSINDLSQCLDVIAHEFTHCVTGSVMTYNSYMNDYGAINEAMSDIQGKNCAMMEGDSSLSDWVMGSRGLKPVRSMSDPHEFQQPEFTWDEYYMANVEKPSTSNDHGGVHFNSSLLNQISWYLVTEGGMSLDEARTFWFMTDCAMVPQTDYAQLAELLPWVLKTAGMEQYEETLADAIHKTRLGDNTIPETMDEDHAMLMVSLPDTEAFDTGNWMMIAPTVDLTKLMLRASTLIGQLMSGDFSFLPGPLQDMITEEKAEAEALKKAKKEESGGLLETLGPALMEVLSDALSEEETEEQTQTASEEERINEVQVELMRWLTDEFRNLVFISYGFAGQDGSTLRMVVRPGRCIPILQHAIFQEGSDQPDQIVFAVYVNGKWYDLELDELMDGYDPDSGNAGVPLPEASAEIVKAVIGENGENLANLRSLEDMLDLFTVDVKGGESIELSSDGLDKIVIPEPTPPAEKEYGSLEPGRKSRPKLKTESVEENLAQTESESEALDKAA